MDSQVIDNIVESLVSGNMGVDDFMQAVQDDIEAHEASTVGTSTRSPGCKAAEQPSAPG